MCSFFIFHTAFILVAGTSAQKNFYTHVPKDKTRVIDLADPLRQCESLDKLEYDKHTGAAYGLLENAYPIFCGGKFGGIL